jgi:hypothetical protein
MDIPPTAHDVLLQDAVKRDRTTARRVALFNILLTERYLTREQLIVRVEGILEAGCFGESSWGDTFFRDMQVVKRALSAAGYQPAYSRRPGRTGYYLRDEPVIGDDLSAALDGSVAEVDASQIAILKGLSFQVRFQQGCSISNLARQVVAQRIRQRDPQLSMETANRLAVQGEIRP